MYVCLCHAVTDADILEALRDGHTTAEAVMDATGAGTGCGSCREEVMTMVQAGRFHARACHRSDVPPSDGRRHLATLPLAPFASNGDESSPASAA